MTVQCPSCNLSIDKTARFCPACGSEVDPEVTAEVPAPDAGSSRPPSSVEGRFLAGQLLGERYRIVQRLGGGRVGGDHPHSLTAGGADFRILRKS